MGSRGPAPKDPAIRQRRNQSSTRAVLSERPNIGRAPSLPDDKEWHPRTRAWWRDLWRSPMAEKIILMDRYSVVRLAHLIDLAHWCPGDIKLEESIARLQQPYGLTPMDRRRLEWTIEEAEAQPVQAKPAAAPAEDPRKLLRMVQ